MKFSIPYNGDLHFLTKLISNFHGEKIIHELYFAGNPLKILSGRRPKIKNYIINEGAKFTFDSHKYDDDIIRLIEYCKSHNIKSNLLLNFSKKLTSEKLAYVANLIV